MVKLFLSENRTKISRIDSSIVTISPFRVNIPSASQRIRFGAKMAGVETDNKVESREKLRPMGLSMGQNFGSRKVLKVFMIRIQ